MIPYKGSVIERGHHARGAHASDDLGVRAMIAFAAALRLIAALAARITLANVRRVGETATVCVCDEQ